MSESEVLAIALKALGGIAACATQCMCCEMHARIARDVLEQIRQNLSEESR